GAIAFGKRDETALRQPPVQWHLAAFEANFMEAARTRLLAFVPTAGGLAHSAADAAADTLFRMLGPCSRFNLIQTHLGLALHQVTHLVDHAAHGRRVFQLNRM